VIRIVQLSFLSLSSGTMIPCLTYICLYHIVVMGNEILIMYLVVCRLEVTNAVTYDTVSWFWWMLSIFEILQFINQVVSVTLQWSVPYIASTIASVFMATPVIYSLYSQPFACWCSAVMAMSDVVLIPFFSVWNSSMCQWNSILIVTWFSQLIDGLLRADCGKWFSSGTSLMLLSSPTLHLQCVRYFWCCKECFYLWQLKIPIMQ